MDALRTRLSFVVLAVFGIAVITAPVFVNYHAALANAGEPAASAQYAPKDPSLAKAFRFDRGGWIYVHLQGTPRDIGYQHGYLLAPEISDAFAAVRLEMTHNSSRDWNFFRNAAEQMLWPKIDPEYQAELQGIVAGLQARGYPLDLDDIVAMNAFMELPDYYVPWLNEKEKKKVERKRKNLAGPLPRRGSLQCLRRHGSYTQDHQIVMAHNTWTSYVDGARWKIIFDLHPQQGYSMLMDGFPGRHRQRRRFRRQFPKA